MCVKELGADILRKNARENLGVCKICINTHTHTFKLTPLSYLRIKPNDHSLCRRSLGRRVLFSGNNKFNN